MKFISSSYLVNISLCGALALAGCDKSTSENIQEVDSTSTTTNVDEQTVEYMPLSKITAENTKYATLVGFAFAQDSITDDQKKCVEDVDENIFAEKAEIFYKDNFTEDELKELNDFYSSEEGRLLNKVGLQQIFASLGIETNEEVAPSDEQMANIMKKMMTPTFTKFQRLSAEVGDNSLTEMLKESVDAELKKCGINAQI